MSSSRVFSACRSLMAASKAGTSAGKSSAAAASEKPRNAAGILKPVPVSPAMRKFLGVPEISRAEAVKKIWDHIKLHRLQNPTNKREIFCDEELKSIFDGKDKVGMLEIAKLISPHFLKSN